TSYGKCALYLIMKQEVGDLMQGGAVKFPVRFSSSAMRPRFNPRDGQLYIAGLQGWQTEAARITGLDRVRYTGKPVYMARDLKVERPPNRKFATRLTQFLEPYLIHITIGRICRTRIRFASLAN